MISFLSHLANNSISFSQVQTIKLLDSNKDMTLLHSVRFQLKVSTNSNVLKNTLPGTIFEPLGFSTI